MAFSDGDVKQAILREMVELFTQFIQEKIYKYDMNELQKKRGKARLKTDCTLCGGFYFKM